MGQVRGQGRHELNLAASQYGAIVEGPIGANASFFLNARRSYLDLLFKALGQVGYELTGYPVISTYEDFTPNARSPRLGGRANVQ